MLSKHSFKHINATTVLWIAVFILLAVIPVFVNTAIGYVPILSAILLIFACLAYLFALRRFISFDIPKLNESYVRGDSSIFSMPMRNRSFLFAPHIEMVFSITNLDAEVYGGGNPCGLYEPEIYSIALPPRSTEDFTLNICLNHIGRYEVGIQSMRLYDPLGIFSVRLRTSGLSTVSVSPVLADLRSHTFFTALLQDTDDDDLLYIKDGTDYSCVREYRIGDPMRNIHWKLSSKSAGDYFTRLYETQTSPNLSIYLDFESPACDAETLMGINDAVIECGLSLEAYASSIGHKAKIAFVDRMGVRRQLGDGGSYRAMTDASPLIHEGTGEEAIDLIRRSVDSASAGGDVVVCTSNITDDMAGMLISLKNRALRPLLIAIAEDRGAAPFDLQARVGRLCAAGVRCWVVRSVTDLAAPLMPTLTTDPAVPSMSPLAAGVTSPLASPPSGVIWPQAPSAQVSPQAHPQTPLTAPLQTPLTADLTAGES